MQQYWTQFKCAVSLENLLSVCSLLLPEAQSWELKQSFSEGKGFAIALFKIYIYILEKYLGHKME